MSTSQWILIFAASGEDAVAPTIHDRNAPKRSEKISFRVCVAVSLLLTSYPQASSPAHTCVSSGSQSLYKTLRVMIQAN